MTRKKEFTFVQMTFDSNIYHKSLKQLEWQLLDMNIFHISDFVCFILRI